MKVKSKLSIINLEDFPSEEIKSDWLKIRVYDETSLENYYAVLSHYLHNPSIHRTKEEKETIVSSLLQFLNDKKYHINSEYSFNSYDDLVTIAAEPSFDTLFSDFFNVPYPNPDTAKFSFIDLFAGIGGIRLPFNELGYSCVFSSEWDKNAQKTYFANFGEMPFGDICQKSTKKFIPEHFDVLLAGFPCQAFSIMGKMKGFEDTRGTLFFEVASILKKNRPKAFLLENVKQLTTHDGGKTFKVIQETLRNLEYEFKWKVLNALDFGLPQKRERVIIVGFRDKGLADEFDFDFEKKPYNLNDILEEDENIDSSLYASEMIREKRKEKTIGKNVFYPSVWHENKAGNISILDHACALRTGASYNYLLINGVRRPSSRELLRFQGFPDNFKIAVSHSEIRRQTGNSVPVPMIREIANKMNNILKKHY